jgi:hypothetical protein
MPVNQTNAQAEANTQADANADNGRPVQAKTDQSDKSPTVGFKNDAGKLRIDLFSPFFIEAVSAVQTKVVVDGDYPERNWEDGMHWSRLFGATMRHMWRWWMGEELDQKTKLPHLWHAGCCIMYLVHYDYIAHRHLGNLAETYLKAREWYSSLDNRPHKRTLETSKDNKL